MRVIKINHRFLAKGDPKQRILDMSPTCATVNADAVGMVQYMQHFHTIDIPSLGFFISNQTLHVRKRTTYNPVFAFLHNVPWVEGLVLHYPFTNDDLGLDLGVGVPKYTSETSPNKRLKFLHVPALWSKAVYQLLLDNRDSLERFEGVVWDCNWVFPVLTHLIIHQDKKSDISWKDLSPLCFPSLLEIKLPKSWLSFYMVNKEDGETVGEPRNNAVWWHTMQQKKKRAAIEATRAVLLPFLNRDATSLIVNEVAKFDSSAWKVTGADVSPHLLYPTRSKNWKPVVDPDFVRICNRTQITKILFKAHEIKIGDKKKKRGREHDEKLCKDTKKLKEAKDNMDVTKNLFKMLINAHPDF